MASEQTVMIDGVEHVNGAALARLLGCTYLMISTYREMGMPVTRVKGGQLYPLEACRDWFCKKHPPLARPTTGETRCWTCKKAVARGCPWFTNYMPVPGWRATATTIVANDREGKHAAQSYKVHECPEYDRGRPPYPGSTAERSVSE